MFLNLLFVVEEMEKNARDLFFGRGTIANDWPNGDFQWYLRRVKIHSTSLLLLFRGDGVRQREVFRPLIQNKKRGIFVFLVLVRARAINFNDTNIFKQNLFNSTITSLVSIIVIIANNTITKKKKYSKNLFHVSSTRSLHRYV